ncbi:phosphatase PAP2 family protein [Leptospira sp. 96542]|nr:phosphatase PAP2 family protein [Leptospira sp. 96542]
MNTMILAQSQIWFSSVPLDFVHGLDASLAPILQTLSVFCHHLGGSTFFLGLISFLYIYFRPKLAFELAFVLLTSGVIGSLLKFYLESPRPFPYPEAFNEKAFGLPSGHVYSGFVVWGLLTYRIKNLGFRIFAVAVILFMPISRMYLRVHYLGDVSLGLALGITHLLLCIWFFRFLETKNLPHYFILTDKYRTLSLLGVVITFFPIVLDTSFLSTEHFESLSTAIMASGSLCGFWIGILFYPRFSKPEFLDWTLPTATFSPKDPKFGLFWQTIIMRALILCAILILLYVLPGMIVKKTIWGDNLIVRYARYMLVSFSLVVIFPMILQNIKQGKFLK